MRRAVLAACAAAAAIVLFLVLRPDDDDGETTIVPRATETARTATRTTPERRGPVLIRIAVRGGRVIGGVKRATLERGERAVLFVTADVSDHVHLHGYDRFADVAPGRPARLRFRATIAGRFEAELEDAGVPILALEVRP